MQVQANRRRATATLLVAVVLGCICVVSGVILTARRQQRDEESARQARRDADIERRRLAQETRDRAPLLLAEFRAAHAALRESIVRHRWQEVGPRLGQAQNTRGLIARANEVEAQAHEDILSFEQLLPLANGHILVSAVVSHIDETERSLGPESATSARGRLEDWTTQLSALPGEVQTLRRTELSQLTRRCERLRRRIETLVAQEEQRQAELAELRLRCGTRPDGAHEWAARRLFRSAAHDPDSVELVSCTPPALDRRTCWTFDCTFRARNGFGALRLQDPISFTSDGRNVRIASRGRR